MGIGYRFVADRCRIAVLVLGFIGAIFVFKYAGRRASIMEVGAFFYLIAFVAAVRFLSMLADNYKLPVSARSYLLFLFLVTLVSAVAVVVLPEKSGVTRLPALSGWLRRLLSGEFPYGIAQNPSAFPALFLIALPFYWLGNLGLLEVVGILIFGLSLLSFEGRTSRIAWMQLLVLLLLPTTYYEIVTRSELFFNMSMILALLIMANNQLDLRKLDFKFIGVAILMGLALSTRSVVGLVYVIFVAYSFRRGKFRNVLLFSVVVMIVFCLTLIPFVAWNFRVFMSHGPFAIQFSYVSTWTIIGAILLALIVGVLARSLTDVVYYSGLLLFGIVSVAFAADVADIGLYSAVFRNGFDVGYFIFCVPFLVSVLGTSQHCGNSISSKQLP